MTEKKRRKRYCRIMIVVLIALFLFAFWQTFFVSVPLRISPETTIITEPRDEYGGIDYEEYLNSLNPPETKTDKNGYRLLVEKLNFDQLVKPAFHLNYYGKPPQKDDPHGTVAGIKKRMCSRLGLVPENIHVKDGISGITFQEYLSGYYTDHPEELQKLTDKQGESATKANVIAEMNKQANNPLQLDKKWTKEIAGHVIRWEELNRPLFDLLTDSVRREHFIQPVILNVDSQIENLSTSLLRLLNLLALRCNYRIRTGHIDGVIDDLITLHRWRYYFYQQMIPLYSPYWEDWFDDTVMKLNIAANPDYSPTKEQWERFERETSLPISFDVDRIKYNQRLAQLDSIQSASRGVFSRDMVQQGPLNLLWHIGIDWNIVAKSAISEVPTQKKSILLYRDYMIHRWGSFSMFPFIIRRNEWQFLSRENRSIYMGLFKRPGEFSIFQQEKIENKARFRKVLFAMEKYRLEHGTWPPAMTRDAKGRPLHSWRVLLLPYLGHEDLYHQLRLNEPWDSEHNRRFHKENINEYRRVDNTNGPLLDLLKVRSLQAGETYLSVIVGKESLFDESGQGKTTKDYLKGKANISPAGIPLIVPRANPVCWMKPDEEVTLDAATKGVNYLREDRIFEPRSIGYRNDYQAPIGFVGGSVSKISITIRNDNILHDIMTGQLNDKENLNTFFRNN